MGRDVREALVVLQTRRQTALPQGCIPRLPMQLAPRHGWGGNFAPRFSQGAQCSGAVMIDSTQGCGYYSMIEFEYHNSVVGSVRSCRTVARGVHPPAFQRRSAFCRTISLPHALGRVRPIPHCTYLVIG